MKLVSKLAAACAVALTVPGVQAQSYSQRTFDIVHTIQMSNVPIYGSNDVRGQFFDHVWRQDAYGNGLGWETAPPEYTPPMPSQATLTQPPSFQPYGVERLIWPWGSTPLCKWPFNYCLEGYSAVNPPCSTGAWGNVQPGFFWVQPAGTATPWSATASVPSTPATFATSEIDVQPFSTGSGYLSATIRSAGQSHYDYAPNGGKTYAFAWSMLQVSRAVRPQMHPPGIPLYWGGYLSTVNLGPGPMYWPPNAGLPITRFYDPIEFELTDLASAATRSGVLFDFFVDLSFQGSCVGGNGSYVLDTQRGGMRVRMDHPFITPRGTLDIEIDNGVVVTSRATGCFAAMALPGLGASGPLSIQFPSSTFDFVFDATSVFPGDHDVTFYMGGAGSEDLPEWEPTGAGCDEGVCASGVTESECLASGATWQGAGTACPDVPYVVEAPLGGFEDISGFGVPSITGNCDDCGETVPLGFMFDYFGTPVTSLGLSSNGYLALSGPLDVWVNPPLPSASGPNGVIAGYWDDLNPLAGGDVHYATLGFAPDRRFIAQWTEVPHYGAEYRPHTFQIVLFETTNRIEYRYLDVPAVGGDISPSVGIENPAGTNALALDAAEFVPKGNRRFSPAPIVGCPPPSSTAYCTAGTTTNGCQASMSSTGTPSASASSGFVVTASNVEGQKQGLIFYGVSGTAALGWGLGSTSYLCVKAPFQRTGAMNSAGTANLCDGSISVDLLAYLASHPMALGSPFAAGQPCWLQAWFRDPPSPKTTNLSNGLAMTFQP